MSKIQRLFLYTIQAFCVAWVIGDVFMSSHTQNIIASFCAALTVAIAIGLHLECVRFFKNR